jgi:hypothetical protein
MRTNSIVARIHDALSSMSSARRTALIVLLLFQLPLACLIVNHLFSGFELTRPGYLVTNWLDRVRVGKALYTPETPENALDCNYPPLYCWIGGLLWKIFGVSFIWPRLLNLTGALGYAVAIGILIWRFTDHDLFLSLAGPCLVLSTYSFMTPWMIDIDGVNALHVGFGMTSFLLLSYPPTRTRVLVAGVLMLSCALTKQTGLAYVVAGTVILFVQNKRLSVLFLAITAIPLLLVFLWLNHQSQGWFYTAIIAGGTAAPWFGKRIISEVIGQELFGYFGLLTALSIFPLLHCRRGEYLRTLMQPIYVLLGAGLGVACISQPKWGSGPTQSLMLFGALAVCGCVGLKQVAAHMPTILRERFVAFMPIAQLVIVLLPALLNYSDYWIDEQDNLRFQKISEVFARGRTCFYELSYMPVLFGQKAAALQGADFFRGFNMDFRNKSSRLVEPLERQEYDFILLATTSFNTLDPSIQAIQKNYNLRYYLPVHSKGEGYGFLRHQIVLAEAKRRGVQ